MITNTTRNEDVQSKQKEIILKIQINTDHSIDGNEAMAQHTETVVENTLGHLSEHVSRVEVHLSDENGEKGGDHDKRCMMEARLERHQPVAVTQEAESLHQAIEGAATKLKHALDHILGRLRDH